MKIRGHSRVSKWRNLCLFDLLPPPTIGQNGRQNLWDSPQKKPEDTQNLGDPKNGGVAPQKFGVFS